jgi:MerR family transcriptional regulator, light-induced transcriptional regulator
MDPASESASKLIKATLEDLVKDAMDRQWSKWPSLRASFDEMQVRRMEEDTRFHLEFIESALWFGERALLDDYLVWCKVLFTNLNLPSEWIEGSIGCVAETLDANLPEAEASAAGSYIDGALGGFRTASVESSSFIAAADPLGSLAQQYLRAVLDGRQADALRMVRDAVAKGSSVRDVYTGVFQPTQREVGRLWLTNQITVAQEHYITAVTQVAMAQLYPEVFDGTTYDRTVVAACVGNELHELGIRMVADFFQMDGWNTHYLGANTPSASIVEAVRESKADVLALSATMAFHLPELAETIALLRADDQAAHATVLVGGYPFIVAPGLWRDVGADGFAPDAASAIRVAAELVGE